MKLAALCVALALPATSAFAHSVGTDVSAGSADLGGGEKSTNVSWSLSGDAEVIDDQLSLNLGYSLMKDEGSALRHMVVGGADYTPNDHWSFGLMLSGTSKRTSSYEFTSEERLIAKVKLAKRLGKRVIEIPDSLIPTGYDASDRNFGASLSAGYDTFGESDFETTVDLSLGLNHYSLEQPAFDGTAGTAVYGLNQVKVGLSLSETLFQDTDATLRLSYYRYNPNPYDAGYKLVGKGTTFTVGAGMPIAPLQWELRPGVTHRFARWINSSLNFGFGKYVVDKDSEVPAGSTFSSTLKLNVKPIKAIKIFASFTLQTDSDAATSAERLWSRYFGLGVDYRF